MVKRITSRHFDSCSHGTGSALVLLHGWGTNSECFNALLPYLRENFQVIAIDLPGYGRNFQKLPEQYSLEAVCSMLADAIPSEAILVGWSLGGLIAQQYALQYPNKISGLVTLASTPMFVANLDWPGIRPEVLKQFAAQLSNGYARTLERFLAIQAMGSETAKQDVKVLKQLISALPSPTPSALDAGLGLLEDTDLRQQIGRIECPTLRIYGKRDSLVPVSAVDHIHALHPRADNVILPHAAHAPFITHPQACAEIICRFAHSNHGGNHSKQNDIFA